MKRSVKIILGIVLLLIIAGIVVLYAHRCMRGMRYAVWMNRPGRAMDFRHMKDMGRNANTLWMRGMRPGMGTVWMDRRGQFMSHHGMRRGMGANPGFQMGRGMGQMHVNHMGWGPMGHGGMRFESIPNLTDKQKKDIADLRQKQNNEMMKFRDEMTAKIKSIRENDRKDVLNLLTDEQKKFVESGHGNTNTAPRNVK